MPYRICKSFEIENGHMLSKHPDLCKFPHGHTRKVEFVLEADGLDENEMVCDFKILKETMWEFLESWDHALCMNTADPTYRAMKAAYGDRIVGFEGVDPTTEILAKTVHDTLKRNLAAYASRREVRYPLRHKVRVVRVRVWETSSAWAEYAELPAD
jgi:6-pyruvoyltetrahydropterin/6-carboxytetrahydropterin synthase